LAHREATRPNTAIARLTGSTPRPGHSPLPQYRQVPQTAAAARRRRRHADERQLGGIDYRTVPGGRRRRPARAIGPSQSPRLTGQFKFRMPARAWRRSRSGTFAPASLLLVGAIIRAGPSLSPGCSRAVSGVSRRSGFGCTPELLLEAEQFAGIERGEGRWWCEQHRVGLRYRIGCWPSGSR
jgi:hypothetical protein